jgi:AraC-like DNA-binding protein
MDTAVFLGTAENFVYGLCSAYFIYESATYFRHRREQRFYRTAAAIMAFWFLLVLKDPIYSCIDTQLHRHLYRTLLLVDMSAVFTCVFFVVELLSPIYITWSRIVQNSAFYLLMLVLYIVTANDIFFDINIVGMAVYCLIWAVRIAVLTKRYHYIVRQNFSSADKRWMWRAIAMFLSVLAAWIYSCYVESSISNIAYIVIVTVVWAVVNHHYRKVGRSIDEVRQIMSEKQPAREIGTNRSYLSAWLNNTLGTNFCDFVNGYRIADAEAMLAGGDCSMTQDEIATTVGFNSLSTFRRAFIKKHGITPRQYCRDKRHKK